MEMRRVRPSASTARVAVIWHSGRPAHAAAVPLPLRTSSFLLIVISNPLWIALTAPGRWVRDRCSRHPHEPRTGERTLTACYRQRLSHHAANMTAPQQTDERFWPAHQLACQLAASGQGHAGSGSGRRELTDGIDLDPIARAESGMRVMGSRDTAGFGVLADHVIGLPAGDVHKVIGGPAGRQPVVREGSAEAVRVHVLNSGLLTAPGKHHADP